MKLHECWPFFHWGNCSIVIQILKSEHGDCVGSNSKSQWLQCISSGEWAPHTITVIENERGQPQLVCVCVCLCVCVSNAHGDISLPWTLMSKHAKTCKYTFFVKFIFVGKMYLFILCNSWFRNAIFRGNLLTSSVWYGLELEVHRKLCEVSVMTAVFYIVLSSASCLRMWEN